MIKRLGQKSHMVLRSKMFRDNHCVLGIHDGDFVLIIFQDVKNGSIGDKYREGKVKRTAMSGVK